MDSRLRLRVKLLLVALYATGMAEFLYRRFLAAGLGTDFPHFYSAAKIVAAGLGHQLYDISVQWQFQQRYTGRVGNFFIHPPFETLFYLPFSWMSMPHAYLGWTLLNLLALAIAAWLFTRRLSTLGGAVLTLVLFLLFAPVTLNFLQGQDAILLLLVFTLSTVALRADRLLVAGCLLALGLFKFQFALPAALIMLWRGRIKFAMGFSGVALALILISSGISGWSSFAAYWNLLFGFDQIPYSGFHPHAMANLRGVCLLLFQSTPAIIRVVMVATSLIVVGGAIDGWRRTSSNGGVWSLALSNTVLAAVLVSFQASPHDLTVLLLPIFLTFAYVRNTPPRAQWRRLTLGLLGVLCVPPVYAYALRIHLYVLMAVPIIVLFGSNYAEIVRVGAGPSTISANGPLQASASKLAS